MSIAPITSFLGNVVVDYCGVFEVAIARINAYRSPFFLGSGVVDGFKSIAICERRITYAGNPLGDYYACEAIAIVECTITYACNTIVDYYACQATAMFERRITYACNTLGNYYAC